MNLSDTGQLQVDGTWQRAGTFRDTPVQFNVEWARAQLGQITKFFTGNDRGWRGDIRFDATVTGTPALLKISSTVVADDFRRYDITSGTSLHLAARCDGEYGTQEHEFHQIACSSPVGTGLITIMGDAGLPGSHRYALAVTALDVPASAIGALARRAKKDLPEDLMLEGTLRGKLSISENTGPGAKSRVEGHGAPSQGEIIGGAQFAGESSHGSGSKAGSGANYKASARCQLGPCFLRQMHFSRVSIEFSPA